MYNICNKIGLTMYITISTIKQVKDVQNIFKMYNVLICEDMYPTWPPQQEPFHRKNVRYMLSRWRNQDYDENDDPVDNCDDFTPTDR